MAQMKYKNRNGTEYWFERAGGKTVYTIKGKLEYWRFGGREGVPGVDLDNLGFVDPSGGPYLEVGMTVEGRKIKKIWSNEGGIFFDLEESKND